MAAYTIINIDTNIAEQCIRWRDMEMPIDFPIGTNTYVMQLEDDVFWKLHQGVATGKRFQVIDPNGTTFETLFQETSLTVVQDPVIDEEKLAMAEAIADLYEQVLTLQGGVV
jgi:hypothetical protein